MWPAYLAALLLSLPAPPAHGRDHASRSELDRVHDGGEAPQSRPAVAIAPEDRDEDEDGKDLEA